MNCYTYHSHITHNDELVCNYFYYIKNTDGLFLNGIDEQNNIIINQNYNFYLNIKPFSKKVVLQKK